MNASVFSRAGLFAVALLAICLVTGCNRLPFELAPVEGTVKYSDGSPLDAEVMVIRFEPKDAKDAVSSRVATGTIKSDGTFSLMTMKPGDGAVVGEHAVVFVFNTKYGRKDSPIADKYKAASTTPFTKTVERGKTNHFDFEIEKKAKR